MKPLGDGFIKLIKMVIAPIIFCTVVVGIAGIGCQERSAASALKALLYFEVVRTFALILGLLIVNVVRPGAGMQRGRGDARRAGGRRLRRRPRAGVGRLPAHVIPHLRGRLRQGRDPAGAASRCSSASHSSGSASGGHALRSFIDEAPHDRCSESCDRDARGPDRRVRRDGVHHRQVRPGHPRLSLQADGDVLPDLPAVHLRRARRSSRASTASAS